MLENIFERLPTILGYFCMVLSFLIPYTIHKININIHKYADPKWKREDVEAEKTGKEKSLE